MSRDVCRLKTFYNMKIVEIQSNQKNKNEIISHWDFFLIQFAEVNQ